MNEGIARRLDVALRRAEPELALHAVVRSLLEEGYSRRKLVDVLEEYRGRLTTQGREDDDELVIDIMAVLEGWASETAVRNLMPPPCEAPHAVNLG